jgi:hypothetical protein
MEDLYSGLGHCCAVQLASHPDHLETVVDTCSPAACLQTLVQKGATAATNVQENVIRCQRQFFENHPEVGVVKEGISVGRARLPSAWVTSDAIGHPVSCPCRRQGTDHGRDNL